ncbi:MAG: hydroxymethylglutaryl-CoA reductase, partial [Pseudomonadota bacterium]
MAGQELRSSGEYMTPVPTQWVGPIKITGDVLDEEVSVPMATYESPLWPSTGRGAKVSRLCGGIRCTVVDERMSRSIALRAPNAQEANNAWQSIAARQPELEAVVASTSRFTRLININRQIVGNLLFLRFECVTGDASGHNMVTGAADALQAWLLTEYPVLEYSTISGNFCTDKKVSAVNSILGRG